MNARRSINRGSGGVGARQGIRCLLGAAMINVVMTACSTLVDLTTEPDWRSIFEEKSGIELPADAAFTMVARSDGGFTADFVTIYRIQVPDPEAGGLFDPETYTRAADGGDGEHLRQLTETAGETGDDVSDVHPTACTWDVENQQGYALILCRTAEDGEFLAFETYI